jgi:hypothetical protein
MRSAGTTPRPSLCIRMRLRVPHQHVSRCYELDRFAFGLIPFAGHLHVVNGQIVSIRGYCDPRPMLASANAPA